MANPNPTRQSDYRDVKNPKVWTRDVLIAIIREWGLEGQVIAPEVAKLLNIPKADAACRMGKLKQWHCVKIVERSRGTRPNVWAITPWGRECAERWTKEREEQNEP